MQNRRTFGVIGAMDSEIRRLLEQAADGWQTETRAGLTFYSGMRAGQRIVVVKCGVGKVNAARCAQLLIDVYAPDYVINTGIAGGLSHGLRVGDIVAGAELLQHDFDVTAFGHARGNLCEGDDTKPTVFRSDAQLLALLEGVSVAPDCRILAGRIATGDVFISSQAAKQQLVEEFQADAAEMRAAPSRRPPRRTPCRFSCCGPSRIWRTGRLRRRLTRLNRRRPTALRRFCWRSSTRWAGKTEYAPGKQRFPGAFCLIPGRRPHSGRTGLLRRTGFPSAACGTFR